MDRLQTIARDFGIPHWQLQATIGEVVGEEIKTIEEACRIYHRPHEHDTDTRAIAVHRWVQLCERAIKEVDNIEGVRQLLTRIPPQNLVLEGKLLLKWVSLAVTSEEVREVHGRCTGQHIKAHYAALEKWERLTLRAIKNATTLTAAVEAFKNAPRIETVEIAAIVKCTELVATHAEARELLGITNASSESREIVLRHWLKLAQSPKELRDVWSYCFNHNEIKTEVLNKLLTVCELVTS